MEINATTDGDLELTDFEVFIDGSNLTEIMDVDNKTTVATFVFGDTHTIVVKKVGHEDANQTDYVIQDPTNIINLNLPRKRVCASRNNKVICMIIDNYLFSFSIHLL